MHALHSRLCCEHCVDVQQNFTTLMCNGVTRCDAIILGAYLCLVADACELAPTADSIIPYHAAIYLYAH